MKTIILHGILGKKFGRQFTLSVNSVAEAVGALCSQIKGLSQFLRDSASKGICYRVCVAKRVVGEDELQLVTSADVFEFRPIVLGSKRQGVGQVILGVALLVVGYFTGGLTSKTGMMFIMAGLSATAGGIAQMLAPSPKTGGTENEEKARSYLFDGAAGTMRQGGPVPLGYGRLLVGPQVISAGFSTGLYEEAPPSDPSDPEYEGLTNPGGILIPGQTG